MVRWSHNAIVINIIVIVIIIIIMIIMMIIIPSHSLPVSGRPHWQAQTDAHWLTAS
jgi:hypothetical protein